MPLQIPPDVPSWLVGLVAGPFPVGDEDALRRRARALREVATVCSELADRHAVAVSELSDVATGDSAAALAELGRINTTNLRSVADYCTSLAKQCDDAANSIEYAKKVIIVTLVMLAAQLAWVSGPAKVRTDGMVVYVSDPESAGRVVDWLKGYQRQNPDSFGWRSLL